MRTLHAASLPLTRAADCPPETGWTRSEATEGVDDTNGLAELDERKRIRLKLPAHRPK